MEEVSFNVFENFIQYVKPHRRPRLTHVSPPDLPWKDLEKTFKHENIAL